MLPAALIILAATLGLLVLLNLYLLAWLTFHCMNMGLIPL
jgi:hypothetical protein